MKTIEEQKAFKMWKQFVENLTVEWMVDNLLRSGSTFGKDSFYTFSASGVFDIVWGNKWYQFKIPPHLKITNHPPECRGLTSTEDLKLFKCLPNGVVEDFIKVLEL